MFYRSILSIYRDFYRFFLRLGIYIVLFCFIIISMKLTTLSDVFEDAFISNFDLLLSVKYSAFDYTDIYDDFDTYPEKEDAVLSFFDEISESEGVLYSDLSAAWYPDYVSFSAINNGELELCSIASEQVIRTEYDNAVNAMYEGVVMRNSLSILGVNEENFVDLKYRNVKIVEGRSFSEEELSEGKELCLVSKDMKIVTSSGVKDVEIGDLLPLCFFQTDEGSVYDFQTEYIEVIGKTENGSAMIVPLRYLKNLKDLGEEYVSEHDPSYFESGEHAYGLYFGTQIVQADRISTLDALIEKLEFSDSYQNGSLTYSASTDSHSSLVAGFMSLSESFNDILRICILVSVLISVVLTVYDGFYQKKEIMVLKCLGERTGKIIGQSLIRQAILIITSLCVAWIVSDLTIPGIVRLFTQQNSLSEMLSGKQMMNGYQIFMGRNTIRVVPGLRVYHYVILFMVAVMMMFFSLAGTLIRYRNMNIREVMSDE